MHDNRDLDAVLDEALSSYIAAEPDPSLRARIMARAAEAAPRSNRLWWLAPAAAGAAALAIAFLLHPWTLPPSTTTSNPEPSAAPFTASASPPSAAPVSAVPQQTMHPHPALGAHRTRRSEPPPLIRDASFPTPTPLTAQENILLQFTTEHPDQARRVLAAPATGPIENATLDIAPIHIAALSETQDPQQWQ